MEPPWAQNDERTLDHVGKKTGSSAPLAKENSSAPQAAFLAQNQLGRPQRATGFKWARSIVIEGRVLLLPSESQYGRLSH